MFIYIYIDSVMVHEYSVKTICIQYLITKSIMIMNLSSKPLYMFDFHFFFFLNENKYFHGPWIAGQLNFMGHGEFRGK